MIPKVLSAVAWHFVAGWSIGACVLAQQAHRPGSTDAIQEAIKRNIARVRHEEGRDSPIPDGNEMRITATTPNGTITITAGEGRRRSYTWEGATRLGRHVASRGAVVWQLGLYFPGSGSHWKAHNGITRAVTEEGQQHFKTVTQAIEWIKTRKGQGYIGGRPRFRLIARPPRAHLNSARS